MTHETFHCPDCGNILIIDGISAFIGSKDCCTMCYYCLHCKDAKDPAEWGNLR